MADTSFPSPTSGGGPVASTPDVQLASPTNGQTVAITSDSRDRTLWLTPAGVLPTLTITFPSDANTRIGQFIRIGSSQVVTLLTVNGATLLNTATTIANAGDLYSFQKVAANTWARLIT